MVSQEEPVVFHPCPVGVYFQIPMQVLQGSTKTGASHGTKKGKCNGSGSRILNSFMWGLIGVIDNPAVPDLF